MSDNTTEPESEPEYDFATVLRMAGLSLANAAEYHEAGETEKFLDALRTHANLYSAIVQTIQVTIEELDEEHTPGKEEFGPERDREMQQDFGPTSDDWRR